MKIYRFPLNNLPNESNITIKLLQAILWVGFSFVALRQAARASQFLPSSKYYSIYK